MSSYQFVYIYNKHKKCIGKLNKFLNFKKIINTNYYCLYHGQLGSV